MRLTPECRICIKERSRQWLKNNPGKTQNAKRNWSKANRNKVLESQRRYRETNREKLRERARQYDADNRQKRREYERRYAVDNREKLREKQRRYQIASREKSRENKRRWRDENRGQTRIYDMNRRSRKCNQPATMTIADWQNALDYFHNCCAVCGRQFNNLFNEYTAAQDHWIAQSSLDCPGYVPTNIIPLCHGIGGCNNSKNAKDAAAWLTERYGKAKAQVILARIEIYFASLE